MDIIDGFQEVAPFEILHPSTGLAPFVFNSPHSGRRYPRAFLEASKLDRLTIRRSEDTFVDELFEGVTRCGAFAMKAHFPRAYLDVNREPYELDPDMFLDPVPEYANTTTTRVAAGLGTVARIVADAQEIYGERLPIAEALARIETIYKPYHAALRGLMAEIIAHFGYVVVVDCHSMPSSARGIAGPIRPDVILGDRFGTSCAANVSELAATTLRELGFRVGRNRPYAGGYITEAYGRPQNGVHVLQLEINRGLYMDEPTLERGPGFPAIQRAMLQFSGRLIAAIAGDRTSLAEAAE